MKVKELQWDRRAVPYGG